MKHNRTKWLALGLALVMIVATGCETVGKGAGLGAAIGAGAGAIIGHQSGHAGEGAAIGALLGAAAGAIASDIRARKAKTAQETAEAYNYQPTQGLKLVFENTMANPVSVKPGDITEVSIQYALMGTGGSIPVKETRVLKQNGQVIAQLESQEITREDGTWISTARITVTSNLKPGECQVVQTVSTGQHTISGTATFIVTQ